MPVAPQLIHWRNYALFLSEADMGGVITIANAIDAAQEVFKFND